MLTLVTAALIVDGQLLLAGILYILAASLDLLDGLLARLAKLTSRFGAFLDSTSSTRKVSVSRAGRTRERCITTATLSYKA